MRGLKVKEQPFEWIMAIATGVVVLCSSLLAPAAASAGNRTSPSIVFNHLTTLDGLSNNNVNDLLQDRSGFLWFATDDGLNRFNGYEFQNFRHVPGNENSLTDNCIWTITEGSDGRIWVGTKSGVLNCYDPITDRWLTWELDSDITRENSITSIYEDSNRLIWIGTYRSGLYKLNPFKDTIEHWQSNPEDGASLSSNYVTSIVEDNKGNIWIATYSGLNKLSLKPGSFSAEFIRYFKESSNPNSISDNLVWNLTRSENELAKIYVGTADGLTIYDSEDDGFTQIQIPNPDSLQFGSSAGSVIEERIGGEKILWIDSFAGLLRFNVDQRKFERYTSDREDHQSLIHNHINGMVRDKSGVLWLATENGLAWFSSKSTKFNNSLSGKFRFNQGKDLEKNIRAITRSSDGRMWFGSEEGLFYSDPIGVDFAEKSLAIHKHADSDGINIWSLAPGTSNDLWIGTYGAGLFRLDLDTGHLRSIKAHEKSITIPSIQYNKTVYCDSQNQIWIGFWGYGLARLDPITGKYESWHHDTDRPNSLGHNDVWVIFQDSKGRLWIGTNGGGLNLFVEQDGGRFIRWYAGESPQFAIDNENWTAIGSLSSNSIYSMCESTARRGGTSSPDTTVLWIGTNNGLNKLVVQNRTDALLPFQNIAISFFTTQDGLADNSIKTILEDENGNLWLGTSAGISFFDTQNNTFANYNAADGVIGGDFNFTSAFRDESGIMFMGSTRGLNFFEPAAIDRSCYRPPLLITDFQIFNQSATARDPALGGDTSIPYADQITLSHRQNVFSFQLAALDYNSPSAIEYAYMMEGFDANWIYGKSRRFITYTNLNPGKYRFKAKSTNSDGIWNDQVTEISVIIDPPWWQTGWAMLLYLTLFFSGIYGIIRFQANRSRTQAIIKMQEFEFKHLREVENMKSRFFANLSHEFRTPLTLIKGPLEQLISGRIKKNKVEYYRMLYRNAEKLQHLIDQLLELSQLEAEKIPLQTEELDLIHLLQGFVHSFRPLAEQKDIAFAFHSNASSVKALIDKDKLEKIINNLLSNAFKFTPVGGSVSVQVRCETENDRKNQTGSEVAVVSVSDSGIGIPDKYKQLIFNRFFQVDDSAKRNYGGSGIGLALVKELATLHNWELDVSSQEGKGSVFSLKIPIYEYSPIILAHEDEISGTSVEGEKREATFSEKEREASEPVSGFGGEVSSLDCSSASKRQVDRRDLPPTKHKKTLLKPFVLIVEDSADFRFFLNDLLKADFQIAEAENGEEAIALAKEKMPDLVLSDIMMPGMDGIEFCHRLKTDWQTSHIPIILLTAKALSDDKVAGLETGADDYITKPFNFAELVARIKNLIEQRRRLREKFKQELNLQPETLATNSIDKEFMQKLMDATEGNLHDEDFDTEVLAQKLFVSRSQLYRKLEAIAGQTPGEFIRMVKLKRAAQMIVENKFSITQIAYEVGFASPAQFTRAFKKAFSCLPSEFASRTAM